MRKFYLGLILLLFLISSSACNLYTEASNEPNLPAPAPVPVLKEDEVLVISAVGDIMMHNTQLKAGYLSTSGDYDYSTFFTHVKPLLSASDLAIGNLETTFAGAKAGYSGYPQFNSPEILASNLKNTGFDVLVTANNHCLDKRQSGLISTLDTLDAVGLFHTGTFRTQEERDSTLIVEKKGLKIAVFSYTYGTNGLSPDKDKPYSVNYIATDKIITDIKKARAEDSAQLVIVCLHFGLEYQPYPNDEQQQIVKRLFEEGADIILGSHPHVLQPAFIYNIEETKDIDSKFAIYSFGNFISDQKGLERLTSIILNLYIGIDRESGAPYFKEASYIPIRTRRYRQDGKYNFEILPIEAALASSNSRLEHFSIQEINDLEASLEYVSKHLQTDNPLFKLKPLDIPLEGLQLIKKW
ncbi:MAG: capsular biosynthesis protein [Firmicutes bacterium HGW-Firmicutes-12]|nr:MAG: capsular biosynthesis protein [Firmicutes bacterium HGW-Firmicutes-12]